MKRLIIFLIRRKLGLKKFQKFRFNGQRSKTDFYYFRKDDLIKCHIGVCEPSNVSLNWLLNDECRITKLD